MTAPAFSLCTCFGPPATRSRITRRALAWGKAEARPRRNQWGTRRWSYLGVGEGERRARAMPDTSA
eukprot:14584259-Alexandrium_andersonii.AAC.1